MSLLSCRAMPSWLAAACRDIAGTRRYRYRRSGSRNRGRRCSTSSSCRCRSSRIAQVAIPGVAHRSIPNADAPARSGSEARAGAGAVSCTPLILIEAPSSAYPSGMLVVETVTKKEETSCDSTRNSTKRIAVLICMRVACTCVSSGQDGEILLHRNMKTSPEMFSRPLRPYP